MGSAVGAVYRMIYGVLRLFPRWVRLASGNCVLTLRLPLKPGSAGKCEPAPG